MKKILIYIGKQILLWFLLFTVSRIVFLLFYNTFLEAIDFASIVSVFWNALRLDFSTICFIMILPFVMTVLFLFIKKPWFLTIIKIYNFLIIVTYSLIATAETGIYGDWLTKLNVKAIKYLSHPSEIYNSASTKLFFILLLILFMQSLSGCLAYQKWVHPKKSIQPGTSWQSILFLFSGIAVLMTGLRGGFQQIPINQSSAYFSNFNILNQVAVNPAWNLIHSIHQNYYALEKNPFIYFSDEEAKKNVDELFSVEKDTTELILSTARPNIFFILLEGWSASMIGTLGGEKGVTPNFDSLSKQGFLFTHCYAPGFRSDQGMACIFSGFPATPLSTITRLPDKFGKLPALTKKFISLGYHTSFTFGGQLDYGNIRGYIYFNNFKKIVEEKDFPSSLPRGKLGVHDEFLYPMVLSGLKNEPTPFYTSVFTSSTHTPYDYPNPVKKFHYDWENEYANSMYYADSCLNDFFVQAKKEAWFKNTLFIIVSDHGHGGIKPIDYNWLPYLQRIPLLLYGEVIKEEFRGKKSDVPVSQVDIASTLLHQCGESSKEFHWSQNLFNPNTKPFAYYAFEVGLGFVTKEGYFTYHHEMDSLFYNRLENTNQDSIMDHGKSYLQRLYQEYFDY